jgi:hypothetical protein
MRWVFGVMLGGGVRRRERVFGREWLIMPLALFVFIPRKSAMCRRFMGSAN